MPRIPVYEQTQATTGNLPSPSINPVMPDAGAGVERGVANLINAITKAREEADALRVEDAVNRLNKDDNKLLYGENDPTNPNAERGAFSVKGKDAFDRGTNPPLADEYLGKYDARVAEISKSLGNDDQRARFSVAAGRMRANFDSQVRRHEQMQGEVYREDVYKGTVATELEKAARFYDDPNALLISMDRIQASTTSYANAKGMSKDATNALLMKNVSDLHSVVVGRLLEENKPLAADAYFKEHRAAMEAKDVSQAIKALNVIGIDEQVSSFVDELVAGPNGPQNDDNKAFQIDKMSNDIRAKFKDNPAARDVALKMVRDRKQEWDAGVAERKAADDGQTVQIAASTAFLKFKPADDRGAFDIEAAVNGLKGDPTIAKDPVKLRQATELLKERFNLWQTSAKQRETERRGKIWDAVNTGKGLSFVRQMKEFKELDGTDQRTLINQIESELKPATASAASKEELKEIRDANYFELTRDPARLAVMTEAEIVALTPDVGRGNVMKAITEKRRLGKDAETVTIDKDQLYQRAKSAGINVDKPSDKDKALLGDLWKRAEEIIYATQKGATRPIDRKEKEKIFDTLLLEVPVRMQQKGGMFGDGSISYENKRLFQVKDVRSVGRPGDRDKVIKAFKDKGIEPDEDQILRGISVLNKK